MPDLTMTVLGEVAAERRRQEAKFPGRTCAGAISNELKCAVLADECGEAIHEVTKAIAEGREPGPNLRVELIQVAAVATAWAEALT